MTELERQRRELERARMGTQPTRVCPEHGEHEGEVCLDCYAVQQERIERESAPLRYDNTASALRARVLAELAGQNGR